MSHWKGYVLLIVDVSVPAFNIAMCEAVVGMAGRSPTTDQPDEMSLVKKAIDGTQYIWKFSRNDDELEAPTLEYLKAGIVNNTSLNAEEVDAMLISSEVKTRAGCDLIISTSPENWPSEE